MQTRHLRSTVVRDALHNLAPLSGASEEYRRGLVVGLLSGLQSAGIDFHDALAYVVRQANREPTVPLHKYLPSCWHQ